ncbi:MAG TPA: DUF1510 family protein [Pseudogracilibacillus sp.]|nr:DUF1510 family protein [Pseudogracilibacillus sp.]
MKSNNYPSRSERQRKRRKNERILYSLIAIFILSLGMLIFFISKGSTDLKEEQADRNEVEERLGQEESEDYIDENDEIEFDEYEEEIVIQYVDSDDENVIEAFVGNWPPIGTNQSEPHTTNFEDGSDDRNEIRKAVLQVTNIDEENLLELWIGNGGEQKVIANVQDRSNDDIYRVYLSWIEYEGWQVTLVEKLKEYTGP